MRNKRIIISGGGTGGHIFPALSIANSIKTIEPQAEILFVGAIGKMEMERVPDAGYPIKGLPVAGLQRRLTLSNLALPFKVLKSIRKAGAIIKEFQPDVVVGVGGYASAPTLWSAANKKIPTLIQEQNSYAGLTNKILGKKAAKICVAYSGMEKFFPKEKIVFTGNPIRKEIKPYTAEEKREGYNFFGLEEGKKCLLILGGSLGCGTLNRVMKKWVTESEATADYQVIWQSGKFYKSDIESFMSDMGERKKVKNFEFIKRMDYAFAAADVIVSRAGAGTISELCASAKATIFVPSPNVAEDHQTHNAMALVNENAGMIVKDIEAQERLIGVWEELLKDEKKIKELEKNILSLAKPNAGEEIAREVLKLANK